MEIYLHQAQISVQWTQRDGLIARCLRIATEILMKGGARTKKRDGEWISANCVGLLIKDKSLLIEVGIMVASIRQEGSASSTSLEYP